MPSGGIWKRNCPKTLFNQGQHQCNEWVGCLEHGTYGKLTVTWPDGTKSVGKRSVSYMAAHKILHGDMPHIDNGKKLEVSHLCHNGICVKPTHLVLGTHETIWKEYPVKVGDSTQNGINHFVCATRFSEVYLFLLFPACLSLYKYVASEFQAAQEVVHFWYFTSWFVLYSLNNARCFLLLCMYVVFCAFYGSHEFLDGIFKKFVL